MSMPVRSNCSSVFAGRSFYLDSKSVLEIDRKNLKKTIEKFGGHVETYLTGNVTHIVAGESRQNHFKNIAHNSVKIVSCQWVYTCSNFRKIIPVNLYSPDKKSRALHRNGSEMIGRLSNEVENTSSQDATQLDESSGSSSCDFSLNIPDSAPNMQHNFPDSRTNQVITDGNSVQVTSSDDVSSNLGTYGESDDNIVVPVPVRILVKLLSTLENSPQEYKREVLKELRWSLNLNTINCSKLLNVICRADSTNETSDEVVESTTIDSDSDNSAYCQLIGKGRKNSPFPNLRSDKENLNINNIRDKQRAIINTNGDKENNRKHTNGTSNTGSQAINNNNKDLNSRPPVRSNNINNGNTVPRIRNHRNTEWNNRLPATNQRCSNVYQLDENRGSSLLFVSPNCKKIVIPKPGIVCTYFDQTELKLLYTVIRELGVFEIENTVTARTTHVICNTSKKTVNLHKAIARGCWILNKEWVISSAEVKRWLYEEKYERIDLSPAVKKCRITKQEFGSTYSSDIFTTYGFFYISERCKKKVELAELISLCGGKLVYNSRLADIVIGSNEPHKCTIKESWVFNSVWSHSPEPIEPYLIKQ